MKTPETTAPVLTIDDLQIGGQRHYNAKATQAGLIAEIHMNPYRNQGYTMTGLYNKAEPWGKLGKKQEQQCKALLGLLEQKMNEGLLVAGWEIVGTSTGGKPIWNKKES